MIATQISAYVDTLTCMKRDRGTRLTSVAKCIKIIFTDYSMTTCQIREYFYESTKCTNKNVQGRHAKRIYRGLFLEEN